MIAWLVGCAWGANPLDDCPATVAELPEGVDRTDPRLQGKAVLVVLKEARRVMAYTDGKLATTADGKRACWRVALGTPYPEGHKVRMGDLRTPEGWYRTSDRPWSAFYHAITIHYPSSADAKAGLADGRITQAQHDAIVAAEKADIEPPSETRLGGKILFHGGGSTADWTLGCVALEDADIDALRSLLPASRRTDTLILP
jgi:murein L,D-transpeptidase YafK